MAEKKIEKCAHPGCNCPTAQGNKYCSDYCESIGKQPSIACEFTSKRCLQRAVLFTPDHSPEEPQRGGLRSVRFSWSQVYVPR
jgi:hypothetical protein